jgi:peptidoglycan/xylan/chitin deacetylase (PgdA/CDA1 family)
MMRISFALGIILLFVSGCTLPAPSAFQGETQTPFGLNPTLEGTATLTEVVKRTPTKTESTQTPEPTLATTPTSTPTPDYSPTPTLIFHTPGELTVPILLYNRIEDIEPVSRFYVSPENFRSQLAYLRDQGYTAITITDLILVLVNGGELPARPVVITFDGGDESIYIEAFPIMQEMGFVGVVYLTGNRLNSDGFLVPEHLAEIVEAGWQVGSQGMTHQDLTTQQDNLRYELLQSRLDLETALGVRVTTFSYPFGIMDVTIANKLQEFGYFSAVGLGPSTVHTWGSLYYLNRIEVQGEFTLSEFGALLP